MSTSPVNPRYRHTEGDTWEFLGYEMRDGVMCAVLKIKNDTRKDPFVIRKGELERRLSILQRASYGHELTKSVLDGWPEEAGDLQHSIVGGTGSGKSALVNALPLVLVLAIVLLVFVAGWAFGRL